MPNARTNKLELHNTWLVSYNLGTDNPTPPLTDGTKTDVSKSYIEWAIEHGFAVMDVNVPKYYTLDEVSSYEQTPRS